MTAVDNMQYAILEITFLIEMLFIFFYFGQILHTNLIDFSDTIYQSEWYRYPRSVQRFVLIMIMLAQKPFYVSAFGIIRCNLESFVAVS